MALDTARTLVDGLARRVGQVRDRSVRTVQTLRGVVGLRRPSPAGEPPLLSVIIGVHNVQDDLAYCLDSLLEQTLERIEIILVDDGSTDHSADVMAAYAQRDPRIVLVSQPYAGSGAARNAGIDRARATFITFLDSDDTIPPAAYAYLVEVLQRTGSDFAVGAVQGLKRGSRSRPRWVLDVHRVERLRITIEDFPDAMQDVIPCNRVFRRDFWNAKIGRFPTGISHEGQVPLIAAYVRASSFDLLPATTSSVRIREDPTTIWQQTHQISALRDRVASLELTWEVVSTEASPQVVEAWLGRVLDSDLSRFVDAALRADDEYQQILRAAATSFVARADPAAWRRVRVERKLRLALAAAGDWEAAERVIDHFRVNGSIPKTWVADGRVFADLPFALDLAPELFELSERQTSLTAGIEKAFWRPDGRLEVEGWAFICGVDLQDTALTLAARLYDPITRTRVRLDLEQLTNPAITRWANHTYTDYDRSGFRLVVDADALPRSEMHTSTRWQLVLTAEAAGVRRRGAVRTVIRSGIATRMRARDLTAAEPAEEAGTPYRVLPLMDDRAGFVLHVRFDRLRAVALESRGPHQLRGTIAALRPLSAPLQSVVARQDGTIVARGKLHRRPDGSYDFRLALPAWGRPPHWDFRVVDARDKLLRVSWPSEQLYSHEIGDYGPGTARWRRSPRGFVQISTQPVIFRAHAVRVDSTAITVDVSLQGVSGHVLHGAVLGSSLVEVTPRSVSPCADDADRSARVSDAGPPAGSDVRYRLTFPATARLWGSERESPLPSGTYTIELPLEHDQTANCGVVADLMEQMPVRSLTGTHGVTVARRPGTDRLTLEFRAPLTDDERGPLAQLRLAEWYAETTFAPRDQVFFQCYRGEFATDSQLAIHQELRRRRYPVELVWGVADLSVELPEDARPVLLGSRAWYEAIASSRFLCNNNDFDRFFARGDHQEFLQTFHGYPFKSMGISFWRAREFSAAAIQYECSRRTDAWTSILVPESFCEDIYRQEYLWQGEILVTGYPRNDVLVDPDPGARKRILDRLGVSPDKTVVMYAPTWRDTIATGDWSATYFDALELDLLAEALGPDHVLLLRGHNFNMRQGVPKSSHSQIVDVTRYPEITDLILAADVAILDYSSLRFDWVLTGKPVLFFVPDLADYLSARTALFEYGPTAPGPLLSTTAEVIDACQRLESVSMDFAQAREVFNERFNRLHDGRATQRVVDAFFAPRMSRLHLEPAADPVAG